MSTPLLPLSIQIYSLRTLDGLAAQLDCLAGAGFRHVELIGSQLEDAGATRAALDTRGLTVSSSHLSMAMLRERLPQVLAACKTIGFNQLFMPAVPQAERDAPATYWTALGAELAELARRCAGEGVALGYHNHHWELQVKAGGATAMDLLLDAADGSPLTWQVDVAWLVRGGADPLAWLKRAAGRVASAHAKDIAPAGQALDEDGWADVGTGTLDWRTLAPACKAAGARWLVAEHDKPSDPARFAAQAHRFLQTLAD